MSFYLKIANNALLNLFNEAARSRSMTFSGTVAQKKKLCSQFLGLSNHLYVFCEFKLWELVQHVQAWAGKLKEPGDPGPFFYQTYEIENSWKAQKVPKSLNKVEQTMGSSMGLEQEKTWTWTFGNHGGITGMSHVWTTLTTLIIRSPHKWQLTISLCAF